MPRYLIKYGPKDIKPLKKGFKTEMEAENADLAKQEFATFYPHATIYSIRKLRYDHQWKP